MAEYRVAREGDLAEGEKRVILAGGVEIGLFRLDGGFIAWRNACPHQGGPVCQGRIFRRVIADTGETGRPAARRYHERDVNIVCPWHGAEFDIRTGEHVGSGLLRLAPVATITRAGAVLVEIDDPADDEDGA